MRVWDTIHLLDNIPASQSTSAEHVYDPADSQATLDRIRLYCNQLQTRFVLGLVLGFLTLHTRQLDMIMGNSGLVTYYRNKLTKDIDSLLTEGT